MNLQITIDLENAAFEPVNGAEAARILEALARHIRDHSLAVDHQGALRDVNGNRVGSWHVTGSEA